MDVWGWLGRTPAARWLAVAGLIVAASGAAHGQGVDCPRLRAAIQSADGRSGTLDRVALQQRREIERTQRYADQLNCGQGWGLFGGGGDPQQCGQLNDHLRKMQDNLARIEAQRDQPVAVDSERQAALVARYNAQCAGRETNPADLAGQDDRGFLPVDGRNPADMANPDDLSAVPLNGDIMDGAGEPREKLGQAICVRTCDGGYFPLGSHATSDQLDGLEQLCHASCPNTEAKLYTMGRGGDLASATAADGTSYTALPAAFQFEKSFAPSCTCKPPNQSWVEALADAEKLLGTTGRHDITVTASLSDQMAKPGAIQPGKAGKGLRPAPVARTLADLSIARDAQMGQQAPTASSDSTGIGGPVKAERMVREGEGPTVAVAGPDGIRKRIRLIVP